MISYTAYKVLHLAGVILVLFSLGGLIVVNAVESQRHTSLRKLALVTNGIGLLIALIAGFGLLARLAITMPWPGWVYGKILIWLLLAGMSALIRRRPESVSLFWWGSLLLATIAAYLAVYKPF